MSALNKIIAEILAQANAQADEIISEAKKKAAEILEKGCAHRTEWHQQFAETTERECLEIIKRAESSDRQARRRALLETRNQVIGEVINEAREKISSLPDAEYFDFLFHIYSKNAQPLDGIIHFAPVDLIRIPDGFLERCRQVFPDHSLQISEGMESISRGFVIQYENILQNCSIDSIFTSEEQELRDRVYEILAIDR